MISKFFVAVAIFFISSIGVVLHFGNQFCYTRPKVLQCPEISRGKVIGTVTDPEIDEASGLVASQVNPDTFWTLNDSDGPVCVFAIASNGSLKHKLCLDGAENYDWEAISTAPCDPE